MLQQHHVLHQTRPHVLDVSHDGLDICDTQQASRLQRPVSGRLFCSRLGGVSLVQLQLLWRINLVPPPAGSGELRICIYAMMVVWAAGARQSAHLQAAHMGRQRRLSHAAPVARWWKQISVVACVYIDHEMLVRRKSRIRLFPAMLSLLKTPQESICRYCDIMLHQLPPEGHCSPSHLICKEGSHVRKARLQLDHQQRDGVKAHQQLLPQLGRSPQRQQLCSTRQGGQSAVCWGGCVVGSRTAAARSIS